MLLKVHGNVYVDLCRTIVRVHGSFHVLLRALCLSSGYMEAFPRTVRYYACEGK